MKNEMIDPGKIKLGPPGRSALTFDQVMRVRAFKACLGDLDTATVEKTLENFSRDLNPEGEILVFERVCTALRALMQSREDGERAAVYKVLMACTFYGLNVEAVTAAVPGPSAEFVKAVVVEVGESQA